MSVSPVHLPILLIWFNRPNLARQVLEQLRPLRPANLFVAIDGPRTGHITDPKNVADCRALLKTIDWPCTLQTRLLTENKGCRQAVSSAIDWFFSQVDEGIILEDDCLPNSSFVGFCAEMLDRYRTNEQIMHISGANLYGGQTWGEASYFFSKIPHVWGWASWRRAWHYYDVAMKTYPAFEQQKRLDDVAPDEPFARYWRHQLRATYNGTIDTWDYQWTYAVWQRNGLCITPNQNLITNAGFGPAATHTKFPSDFANLPTNSLDAIRHPARIEEDQDAIRYASKHWYRLPPWWKINIARIKQLFASNL